MKKKLIVCLRKVAMMDMKETKSMQEIISEIPFILKVSICLYIIPAGLNAMYDFGYLVGKFVKTF